jgi:hypothetical protein
MGDPTSSYAAAGRALEFIGAHEPLTQQQSAFILLYTTTKRNVMNLSISFIMKKVVAKLNKERTNHRTNHNFRTT